MNELSTRRIAAGDRFYFAYPHGFVSLPDYSAHRGWIVTVLRVMVDRVEYDDPGRVNEDNPHDRMYEVVAADGWRGHAWESELEPVSREGTQ